MGRFDKYYAVLGVTSDTPWDDIKKAYKKLAIQYHPDKNLDGNPEFEAKFKEVSEAYTMLDRLQQGMSDFTGFEFNEADFDFARPIRETLQREFGDVFANVYSAKFADGKHQIRLSKVNKDLKLSLVEFKDGCHKDVSIQRLVQCGCQKTRAKCTTCNGDSYVMVQTNTILGRVKVRHTCTDCSGSGLDQSYKCSECDNSMFVFEEEKVSVDVPGYATRGSLIFKGLGNWDFVKKQYDDLEFYPVLDDVFITSDSFGDLTLKLDMEYEHLLSGGKLILELPSGKEEIDLEPRVTMGHKITIPNAGLKKGSRLDVVIGLSYPGERHFMYHMNNVRLT